MLHRRALLLAAFLLAISACGESTENKFGAELYEISCAGCHGSDARGAVIGPDLVSPDAPAASTLSDEQIFGAIRVGPGAMPGNPRLSDAQITSLVEYLRDLQREQ